jgi:hypothetical protein
MPITKKPSGQKAGAGVGLNQVLELTKQSVETTKAYFDYQKEIEVTTRAKIEGQKAVTLGEQDLTKAQLTHAARMTELDNADKDSSRKHEQMMEKLRQEGRSQDNLEAWRERVMAQLEAKQITPEQAAILLNDFKA